jgi:RNA polymerase sigma factor (sigma-70 family)
MDRDELEAFSALYERHAEAVHRYALRRCDSDTAEEVVAQVFTIAWRRRERLPEEPMPWLYGVARRALADQRRGAVRRRRLYERLRTQSESASESFAPELSDGALSLALRRLSPADREVLLLAYWEELSPAELARAMGCSRATLAVRLHRARLRLRKQLEVVESERFQDQGHDHSCVTETESV